MDTALSLPSIAWRRQVLRPSVAAMLFIAWFLWNLPEQQQFDSEELYRGCRNILDWWQGRIPALNHPRPFPLFQYLSGVPAAWAIRRYIAFDIVRFWCTCSLLSLAGIAILFQRVANQMRQPALGWAAIVLLLSGPLLMYANCTFNELPSAFLILSFIVAVTGSAPSLLCVTLFWLSGITKETAPLVLTALWLGAIWMNWPKLNRLTLSRQVNSIVIAFALTVSTNAAFNLFRYGTYWNREYLQPQGLIDSWSWRAQYGVAMWISPNGGMVIFWPTLIATMAGVVAMALRTRRSIAPAAVVAITLAALTVGFSGWWQPFGWYSWGPRLMIPWLPACLMILLRGYPDACGRFVEQCVGRNRTLVATASAVCLLTFPHAMAAMDPSGVGRFFAPDWRFPHGARPENQVEEYSQNIYLAWQKLPPMLIEPFTLKVTGAHLFECLCFVAALVALICRCRQPLGHEGAWLEPLKAAEARAGI